MRVDAAKFTRADYLLLPEGFPAELMDGVLVKVPSPTWWHQSLALHVCLRLCRLVGRRRVLLSPVDVFIDEFNVLQPDVLVAAPEDRIHPDSTPETIPILVVEVLSPSTADRDREVKAATYLRAGVREVWLVDPAAQAIEVRTTRGARTFATGEEAKSSAVPGFGLRYQDLRD